jgi:hypothetical protein
METTKIFLFLLRKSLKQQDPKYEKSWLYILKSWLQYLKGWPVLPV